MTLSAMPTRFARAGQRFFGTSAVNMMLVLALSLVTFLAAANESPDDQYIRIFNAIELADSMVAKGQTNAAITKYQEAQRDLLKLKKANPLWNQKMVTFRLGYLNERVATLSQPAPTIVTTPTPPTTVQPKTEKKPAPATPTKPSLKLIDPGAEPRKVLRLNPKIDEKQTVEITVKTAMSMEGGPSTGGTIEVPTMKFVIAATPKNLAANGDITFEQVVEDIGLVENSGGAPQRMEAMKTSLETLKGATSTGTISNRGVSRKTDSRMPAGAVRAAEQIKQVFSMTDCCLPEEAIGVGAKWEQKEKVKAQGITLDQTTTYELLGIEGNVLRIKTSVTQHAANQKIVNPAAPQMKSELSEFNGSGSMECQINLQKVLPVQMKGESQNDSTMSMAAGGQKQTITVKNSTSLQLESK